MLKEDARDLENVLVRKVDKQPGLIDCLTPDKFDEKLLAMTAEWKSRHPQGKCFLNYFMKYKAEPIKKTMTADVRSMSGLGFPPGVYNQNGNECMNSVSQREKAVTGKKQLSLPGCIRLLKKTVQQQRTEEELALLGIGDLKLDTMYVNLAVPETVFYRKSQAQKQAVLKKFSSEGVKAPQEVLPNEDDDEDDKNNPLCITVRESRIVRVLFTVLIQIFQKAGVLIGRKEAIVAAPGVNAVPEHYVEFE